MEKQEIRTFGRIRGKRLSAHQQYLVDNVLPKLTIKKINNTNNILEIGFGAGEHLTHLSTQFPNHTIIGAELFVNGVGSLLSQITENNIVKPEYRNIRIWPDDVRNLLNIFDSKTNEKSGKNIIFDRIYILHPDPWPKARHEKRRLFQKDFIEHLAKYLSHGGKIILGTDHTDYFNWAVDQVKKIHKLKLEIHDIKTIDESGLNTRYMQKNKFGSKTPMYLVLIK